MLALAARRSGHKIHLKQKARVRIPPGFKVLRENRSMLLRILDFI
jgi:hypothetical protein